MTDRPVYTLHYFPFSLYSLMVRFALALGAELNRETAPDVVLQLVNLHNQDNLSETYLTEVNPKGQVPALTSPWLSSPIRDSHDISRWLCQHQPELLPPEHEGTIRRLVNMLYNFHGTVLTLPTEERAGGMPNQAAALLERTDISDTHRRALEMKSIYHDTLHGRTLDAEHIVEAERKATVLLRELSSLLQREERQGGPWLLGNRPTILDAHVVPLLAMLMDRQRMDLLKDEILRAYVDTIVESSQWKEVTAGRRTVWDSNYGPIEELDPP